MSETRPIRRRAVVLPSTYACVIQIACSASARRLSATCGRPTITIRASRPAMRTPTVVTVSTVHLYWMVAPHGGGVVARESALVSKRWPSRAGPPYRYVPPSRWRRHEGRPVLLRRPRGHRGAPRPRRRPRRQGLPAGGGPHLQGQRALRRPPGDVRPRRQVAVPAGDPRQTGDPAAVRDEPPAVPRQRADRRDRAARLRPHRDGLLRPWHAPRV